MVDERERHPSIHLREASMRSIPVVPWRFLWLALALALQARPALAQEPSPKPVKVTADAAYVNTAGNSEVQTLTGNEKVEYKSGKWLFTQDAAAVWGTDDGVENAGRYYAGLRGDYAFLTR